MHKALKVAEFEFRTNFKRWQFLLATFGLPFFTVGLIILIALPQALYLKNKSESRKEQTFGIIDETKRFVFPGDFTEEDDPSPVRYHINTYEDREAAFTALRQHKIDGFYSIHADYMKTGRIDYFTTKDHKTLSEDPPRRPFRWLMIDNLIGGRLDEKLSARIKDPINDEEYVLDEEGNVTSGFMSEMTDLMVPYAFVVILVMALATSSGYLLRGLAEEKENRIMEILLSSCRADDLYIGKLIGLCCLGLFQLSAWLLMGLTVSSIALPLIKVAPFLVIISIIFFIPAFLFYTGIAAGMGVVGSSEKESNQILGILILLIYIPLFFLMIIRDSPNGLWAKILSLVPITAPTTIVLRCGFAKVPPGEIILSFVIMVISIYLVLKAGIKIFRLGTLMYGKRPTLREIFRWMKYA